METVNTPDDERDDSALIVTQDADEQREARSVAAQRASRPVDDDGNTVLSPEEANAADESGEPASSTDTERV